MGGTGVIDRFLEVFTRYIDSGFGLLNGEVAFLATTLAAIDITLAAIFWSWAAEEDIIARLAKKTLFVGVFAYLIGNWNNLARIVFESFAGLGLKASGTGMSTADLLSPGRVAQVGIDAGRPILDSISGLMGYISFFENFVQIVVLLFAWIVVLLAFFILAIQLFVTLIEFKLTTLGGFCADPLRPVRQDGVCRRARARQRHLVGCQGPGARRDRRHRFDLVLAIHRGIRRQSAHHRRCHVHGAGGAVAAGARHLRPWDRQRHCVRRSAARRRRCRRDWSCGGRSCRRGRRWCRPGRGRSRRSARRCGARQRFGRRGCSNIVSPVRRAAGEAASNASGAGQGGASAGTSSAAEPPAWARRMKRSQTVSHGASAATHAVRSGDHGGGGASVDLSEGER